MTKDEALAFYRAYHSDYEKIKTMLNGIFDEHQGEINKLKEKLNNETNAKKSSVVTVPLKKESNDLQSAKAEHNQSVKRVVALFDTKRKSIQSNFVRQEYKNQDGEWLLRVHLADTKRTPEMFLDAVRWLFSNNPNASFHRQYIMNIGSLIKHFNTIEHQAMHSEDSIQFSEEAQTWANVYKKKGFSDEEILEKLKEGGYIK